MDARGHDGGRSGRPGSGLAGALLVALVGFSSGVAADEGPATARPGPAVAEPRPPHLIGTYPASAFTVIDGDTLRFQDQPSVRVMAIDTEEVFKKNDDRAAAEKDFAAYARAKRGTSPRPVKFGTPAGEAAKVFAASLLAEAARVRLERDHAADRDHDLYGRSLAHVFFVGPDGEKNLSEELIRAGHSPYFIKYGRSRRFDLVFSKAQAEAITARRGIWGSDGPGHYPDYAERLAWWEQRAIQIDRWRKVEDQPGHVTLGTKESEAELRSLVGKEAVVMGLLRRVIATADESRKILWLADRPKRSLPVVIFSGEVFGALDLDALGSLYVKVRGKITLYKNEPQIVVERADQISTD